MLLYEYRVRDEFEKTKSYAENLRAKFGSGVPLEELRKEFENLLTLCDNLQEILPKEIRGRTNLERHLGFLHKNLSKGNLYQGDVDDICRNDLPTLEKYFRDWCADAVHYDKELNKKISNLLVRHEYDSAIRKAFVILKSRLVTKFGVSPDCDGIDLVNAIFGKTGVATGLDASERQAMRDLLAGLYGVFRNVYGHQDVEPPWHEADAILSMINYVLKRVEQF